MLFDTLDGNPNSKPWHPFLMLSLCVAGAIAARVVIHHSSAAIVKTLRDTPAESVPNAQVGDEAPKR